jgi:hypothetical protein
MASRGGHESSTKLLWVGAILTASAAVFFPRIQGIRDQDESWLRLAWFFVPQDREGAILVPVVVLLTLGLFALVGRWAWGDTRGRNRPARVGFVCSLLGARRGSGVLPERTDHPRGTWDDAGSRGATTCPHRGPRPARGRRDRSRHRRLRCGRFNLGVRRRIGDLTPDDDNGPRWQGPSTVSRWRVDRRRWHRSRAR